MYGPLNRVVVAKMSIENLLKLHPTTVKDVRKEYNLDNPGMMDQAVDILHDWILKQDHFEKKDFSREYLERVILSTKGSVERAKVRMDKICTLRTMLPELFLKIDVKRDFPYLSQHYVNVYMPTLTEDNYRIFIIKMKNVTSSILLDGYRHNMILGEYLKRNDYAKGIIGIMDIRDNDILDLVSQINLADLQNVTSVYTEGFGFRIKNIFIISSSKIVELFSELLKRVLSAKIGQRITVLNTIEALHDHLPKELLPEDFGGQQETLMKLYDKWNEVLTSEEHLAYVEEMRQACTNETLRQSDRINYELGIAGTFKSLSVD